MQKKEKHKYFKLTTTKEENKLLMKSILMFQVQLRRLSM